MNRYEYHPLRPRSRGEPDGIWFPLLILGGVAAVVIAFPALVIGVVLQRITARWRYSRPLWLLLTTLGTGLTFVLVSHGLAQQLFAQIMEIIRSAQRYHADFSQWKLTGLWDKTWPIWLQTLGMAPLVALWREQESLSAGRDRGELLIEQERKRTRIITRSKRKAKRRTQRPERVPDAVQGQMVVGVPIDDEGSL